MNSEAIVRLEEPEGPKPTALLRHWTDMAGILKDVILRSAIDIKGKKYLPVEAWSTIASTDGCTPSIREVTIVDTGIRSVCDMLASDGTVISSAEGFVGRDEIVWSNRPEFARRAMAQTRSISRVCRTRYAFVVMLMNAGIETTPAEEMMASEPDQAKAAASAKVIQAVKVAPVVPASSGDGPKVRIGKSRGKLLSEIDAKDLSWQLKVATENVAAQDEKWHKSNCEYLEQVQAEAARRIQG